jgi:hypothetical protein
MLFKLNIPLSGVDTDVCCRAQCYHVPCPDASMANDTTSCVAACPQGNGSAKDTDAYASCEQSCYSSHFFPATAYTGGATGTVASASASETGSNSASATGCTYYTIPKYFVLQHTDITVTA